MIKGTRSGERQGRTFKALNTGIGQSIRKSQNLCMPVTIYVYGKQQEIQLEK